MFYIRADANNEIATGHVMRCMSIADEMEQSNIKVCFLTADHNADVLIKKRGFEVKCLDSVWNNLENEISEGKLITLLKNTDDLEGIIVDTYYVTESYLQILHDICKTIYIDDIFSLKRYPVDILINYNIYGEDLDYKSRCLPDTEILLGTKYVPLRKEFKNIDKKIREKVKAVFVSTGGTDNYNIAGNLLCEIFEKKDSELSKLNFHVISGVMNKNMPYLLEMEKKYKNIIVYQNVSDMSEIMMKCDIAVSACGSTMYELCACGLPIVTYSFADNQMPGIRKFAEKGIACNCGDLRDDFEKVVNDIVDKIDKMCTDRAYRKKYVNMSGNIVCNNGVKKIVDEII
ncbi:putative uncharacterized protein [Clostridium sp. CAG:253]|nr:putative uncharacterized protein [Clostridium sp. CAG:253]